MPIEADPVPSWRLKQEADKRRAAEAKWEEFRDRSLVTAKEGRQPQGIIQSRDAASARTSAPQLAFGH